METNEKVLTEKEQLVKITESLFANLKAYAHEYHKSDRWFEFAFSKERETFEKIKKSNTSF